MWTRRARRLRGHGVFTKPREIGLVEGVGGAPQSAPRENLTTDPYYTDGYRAVLVFDRKPTSMAEIDFFEWDSCAQR